MTARPFPSAATWRGAARGALVIITAAALLLLAVTGFAAWVRGAPLGGWPLVVHGAAAPLFISGVAIIALVGAGRRSPGRSRRGRLDDAVQLTRWLALLLSLTVAVSILCALAPLASQVQQRELIDVHRGTSIALVATVALHLSLCLARRSRRGRSPEPAPAAAAAGEDAPSEVAG